MLPAEPFPGRFRTSFWIAPPRARAVRRGASVQLTSENNDRTLSSRRATLVMPQWLSVILASRPSDTTSSAFTCPIPTLSSYRSSKSAAVFDKEDELVVRKDIAMSDVKTGNEEVSAVIPPPATFAVPIYVWPDSTLREILETVLACSAAARRVLLGTESKECGTQGRRPRKARRTESATRLAACSRGPDTAQVLHVSVGADKTPRVAPLATLALSAPRFGRSDYITMEELREARYGWKTGDLIVLLPQQAAQ